MVDKDFKPKPAYVALQDLIRREWMTRANGETDAEGHFACRGFGGSYEARILNPPGGEQRFNVQVSSGRSQTARLTLQRAPANR